MIDYRIVCIVLRDLHPLYIGGPMTSLYARKAAVITALAAGFLIASAQVQIAQQPTQQSGPGTPAAAGQRGGRGPIDPRVQQRTYLFADTNEQLPYAVF